MHVTEEPVMKGSIETNILKSTKKPLAIVSLVI